ncbi:hypothetical protein [Streptomyces sp. NPDC046976]|uniref:hypothetical protein n=1 Tax=Streptomyces sp. NPDC046976 TaxID=3155258 RepID=UPI0033E5EBA4
MAYKHPGRQRPQQPKTTVFTLPDGTTLSNPRRRQGRELQVGWWVRADERPHQIIDMRACVGSDDRVIHLAGYPTPLLMRDYEWLPVYEMRPPAPPPRRS